MLEIFPLGSEVLIVETAVHMLGIKGKNCVGEIVCSKWNLSFNTAQKMKAGVFICLKTRIFAGKIAFILKWY